MKKLVFGFISLGIVFSGTVSSVYAFDAFYVSDQAIGTVSSTEDNIDGGITNSQYETEFDNLVNEIYELRKKGKSFEEIDKNLDNIIEKNSNKLIYFVSYSPSDKFYEYANLNSQEKKLFNSNKAKGQQKLEKQMDLFNNKVGLNLAKENPITILHSTFKSNTRAKVRAGKCRIIKNGKLVKSSKAGEK